MAAANETPVVVNETPVVNADVAVVSSGGGGGGGDKSGVKLTSLYVGDLDYNVNDSQMYDLFSQMGQVVSVRVCRDTTTGNSLGYGYVNFADPLDAERTIKDMNFTPLNGKPIRIMNSNRDPSIRKSGAGNIYIKNLDKDIDNKALHDTFATFGNILTCKVATDPFGQSKGYGYVQYESKEYALKAIEKLNGMLLNDKQVFVGPFLPKQEREKSSENTKLTNIYVKNFADALTDEDFAKTFGQFGKITSAVVMRDTDGKSKCFGFVNFENSDEAAKAVEDLNGKKFDGKEWYVGKAQKKAEREVELKQKFEQNIKQSVDKYKGCNLYVKNLEDTIDDDKLKELFSQFGAISSCKVMRDPTGISKGSGFVAFSTPEEASRALLEMNGKMIATKPLYVALAQRKEERRAKLQAQFSQLRPAGISSVGALRMPIYPPGAQMYYGPTPLPGFGYQHQLMQLMPNFYMPMVPPGQQGQHHVDRRPNGASGQQNQQSMTMIQPQMLPRGPYRYPPSPVLPGMQYDITGMPIPSPVPIGTLATLLANATPERQRTLLGENLYPLVEKLQPEMAAKVTGMLLEMDQTEVLHLLESPEALEAKVDEAMEVLKNVVHPNNAARLADLSLIDSLP